MITTRDLSGTFGVCTTSSANAYGIVCTKFSRESAEASIAHTGLQDNGEKGKTNLACRKPYKARANRQGARTTLLEPFPDSRE